VTVAELTFHPVAKTAQLGDGDMLHVVVGRKDIALYNVGGRFFATDALCTHGHALLTEGYIEGDNVECPMHGGVFEIATGRAIGEPCVTPLAVYPVRVEGDEVYVGVEAA
jgi:nitrite reductase/ring-hydroxylating ferredoxin subunit